MFGYHSVSKSVFSSLLSSFSNELIRQDLSLSSFRRLDSTIRLYIVVQLKNREREKREKEIIRRFSNLDLIDEKRKGEGEIESQQQQRIVRGHADYL